MSDLSPERWAKLWRAATGSQPPSAIFAGLVASYAAPQRHYHTHQHIVACLDLFDTVRDSAREPVAVELALWFHDVVYDPRASDNEERSAAHAQERLQHCGATSGLVDAVEKLILATKHHAVGGHVDAPLLVDIDLSILGQPPERYWEYERQVRAEYAWVPAEIFRVKRAELLQKFLDRPRLYQTSVLFEKLEAPARLNLKRSIAQLLG